MSKWKDEIISNNHIREQTILCPAGAMSSQALRRYQEDIPDSSNIRPSFFHDTDRIIHSQAYSRYIDKTQVFFLFKNDHITHRVLHVQLVSKIGRTIGRFLKLNEDLIEAIALGHDLGHAPFGHDGETILNKICIDQGIGHFFHNAQSVRCLMQLETQPKPLNLTLQVLDGILCHNGEEISEQYTPSPKKTWDKFLYEYDQCWTSPDTIKKLKPFTMEGCVVRVSDVIGYIGRDLEDAIAVNLITREDIPDYVNRTLGNNNRDIINTLIIDLISNSFGENYLSFSKNILNALKELQKFSIERIYQDPRKISQNNKIKSMFNLTFNQCLEYIVNGEIDTTIYRDFLSKMPHEYITNTKPARIVVDYIAGMTDDYIQDYFKDSFVPTSFGKCI